MNKESEREELNGDLEEKVKEEWEEVVKSDSVRLVGMEEEVMAKISDRKGFRPLVWLKNFYRQLSRAFTNFTPAQRYVVGGAVAASVAIGLLIGLFVIPGQNNGNVERIVFQVPASNAKNVTIAGEWEGFKAMPMHDKNGDGVWTARVKLKEGKYEYFYRIDGNKYATNYPKADEVVSDWGGKNGIIYVNPDNGKDDTDNEKNVGKKA